MMPWIQSKYTREGTRDYRSSRVANSQSETQDCIRSQRMLLFRRSSLGCPMTSQELRPPILQGIGMFALMAVLVIYVVLGGGTTDNFRALLISYMKALTNLPVSQSPLSEYKWALASITVNFFTILLTLPQLFRANSQRYEQVAIFCLGGITLAHIISLPFTVIERFDFNIVVCLTYLVYSGLDYFGVRTARVRNDPAMFA